MCLIYPIGSVSLENPEVLKQAEPIGNTAQCCVAAWIGGKFGGESIYVYVWLSPFTVDLKLSQYC